MLKILAKDTGEIGVFRLPDQSLTLYYHSLSSLQKIPLPIAQRLAGRMMRAHAHTVDTLTLPLVVYSLRRHLSYIIFTASNLDKGSGV